MGFELEYHEFINYIFQEYYRKKTQEKIYNRDINLFKNIIEIYFQKDRQPYFKWIIDKYKELYILDESRIEPGVTKEEKIGLGIVYDYIRDFDFDKNKFNIFIVALTMHYKLYSMCPNSEFGGKLRTTNVALRDLDIEVLEPNEAIKIFNNYLNQVYSDQIFKKYEDNDLFGYIEDCIILCVNLIKLQPFQDGNKRTFRAILNLLFKRVNIPPIFIDLDERMEYKNALIKALKDNDYQDIIKFYYYKICDAIILLDIENPNRHLETEDNIKIKKISKN